MRAISRLAIFRRAVFSSAPVAAWNRRLNSSCRVSASRCSSSSSVRSRMSLARKEITTLALHELRLHRQLLRGEAQRLLGERLRHTGQLEHDAARLDDGHPALRGALALAHARLSRLLRVRLVGEDVDPHLAAALDLARHRDTSSLDLAVGDPAVLERLDPVLAEVDHGLPRRLATPAAAVHLAELRLLRQQHRLARLLGALVFGRRVVLRLGGRLRLRLVVLLRARPVAAAAARARSARASAGAAATGAVLAAALAGTAAAHGAEALAILAAVA